MRKFLTAALLCACALTAPSLTACSRGVDYFDCVSEYRKCVFYCREDGYELKIFLTERESPYCLDGVKGNMSKLCEAWYTPEKGADGVEIELLGAGGEMNYMAVTGNYYLSFYDPALEKLESCDGVEVCLTVDGNTIKAVAGNVAAEGAIGGRRALECVIEYDRARFEKLTEGGAFYGEIAVRLIYDEGCFYYVGLCDTDGRVNAYLVDGSDGRVLAEKKGEARL